VGDWHTLGANSRVLSINTHGLGTNPRALLGERHALGENPRALGRYLHANYFIRNRVLQRGSVPKGSWHMDNLTRHTHSIEGSMCYGNRHTGNASRSSHNPSRHTRYAT
jgi:hypothetical protein